MPRAAWWPGGPAQAVGQPLAAHHPRRRAERHVHRRSRGRRRAGHDRRGGVEAERAQPMVRRRRQLGERHRAGVGRQLEGVGEQRSRAVDVAGGQRIGPDRVDQFDQVRVVDRHDRIRPECLRLDHGEAAIGRQRALDLDRPLRRLEARHFATGHQLHQAGVAQVGVAANDGGGRWPLVHGPRVYRAAAGRIARASYTPAQ